MSRTKMTSLPAPIAGQPQPRVPVLGSAESIASLLTGRGFCCPHFPKYHVGSGLGQGQYPSRLAFFHTTGGDTRISFLDTNKLCSECLNLAVPDGFNFWSTSATVRDIRARDSRASQTTPSLPSRWLDMASSSDSYPRLFQAGTEGFPQNNLGARYIASHCVAPPKTVHIPQLTGAKEAWQWLQDQRKPFYIDQLHLNKGWSPFGEMMAYNDSAIAEETGVAFNLASQTTEQKTKKAKKAPLHDDKAAVSDVAAGGKDVDASGNVKRDKAFPSLEDTIIVTAATPYPSATPTGITHQASKHVQEEKGKRSFSSESAKTASHTEAVIPVIERSGGTPAAASSARSTKKSSSTAKPIGDLKNKETAPKTSSAPGLLRERAEPQALPRNHTQTAEPIDVKKIADRKTVRAKAPSKTSQNLSHTKNWSRPDPIPFDSPIMTLKLDDYKRRATATNYKASLSKSPLKQLLKKDKIKDDNVSFSGPESSTPTPAVASFIKMTTQGESPTPKATSQFIASMVHARPSTVSREAKLGITKTPQSKPPKTEHPGNESASTKPVGEKFGKISDGRRDKNKVDDHVRNQDTGKTSHIDRPRRKRHSRSTSPGAKPRKPHGEHPTDPTHRKHSPRSSSPAAKPKKPHGERPTDPSHKKHSSRSISPESPAPGNQAPGSQSAGDPEPIPEVSQTPAASNTGDTEHKPPSDVTPDTTTMNGPEGKTGATSGFMAGLAVGVATGSAAKSVLGDEHASSKHTPDTSPASSEHSSPLDTRPPSPASTHLSRGSGGASEEGSSTNWEEIGSGYQSSDNCDDVDNGYTSDEGLSDRHSMNDDGHDLNEDDQETSDGRQSEPGSHVQASDDESDGEQNTDAEVEEQDSHNDNCESGTEGDELPEGDDDEEQVGETEEEDCNDEEQVGNTEEDEGDDGEQVEETEEDESDEDEQVGEMEEEDGRGR
ncbi:hypothetical protein DL771_010469 [Monosporascus sp. 5C6A]|nr:hypothetical protein DL771_010469 [Monosporascus sp. 5C6A]